LRLVKSKKGFYSLAEEWNPFYHENYGS